MARKVRAGRLYGGLPYVTFGEGRHSSFSPILG